jgi:hypothetical protein
MPASSRRFERNESPAAGSDTLLELNDCNRACKLFCELFGEEDCVLKRLIRAMRSREHGIGLRSIANAQLINYGLNLRSLNADHSNELYAISNPAGNEVVQLRCIASNGIEHDLVWLSHRVFQRRVKRPRAVNASGNTETSPRGPLERIVRSLHEDSLADRRAKRCDYERPFRKRKEPDPRNA